MSKQKVWVVERWSGNEWVPLVHAVHSARILARAAAKELSSFWGGKHRVVLYEPGLLWSPATKSQKTRLRYSR